MRKVFWHLALIEPLVNLEARAAFIVTYFSHWFCITFLLLHSSFLSPHAPVCPIGPAMRIRLETSLFLLLCKSAQVFDIAASWQWNYPTSPIMGNMWSLATLGLNFFPTCWHLNPLTCTSCLSLYIFQHISLIFITKPVSTYHCHLAIVLAHTCFGFTFFVFQVSYFYSWKLGDNYF